MSLNDPARNPVILIEPDKKRKGCPKCGSDNFCGLNLSGTIVFTCRACKNEWSGMMQMPEDPRTPKPPENPLAPGVTFSKNKAGQITEDRRAVSTTPEFRKGAPIPPPGEEE